jgi:N-glycosylase/DNA lyase
LPWRPCAKPVAISAAALAETVCGGQAFRWKSAPDHQNSRDETSAGAAGQGAAWQGVWGACVARVRASEEYNLEWTCPIGLEARIAPALENYFAADVDFDALADQLPWRTDAVMAERVRAWRGLRLLRQPLGEALLAFLCSSAKQIPHIAQMCETLAARFGEPIWGGIRALPTWLRLTEISERDLRVCGLGYRARFVHHIAQKLAESPGWEDRLLGADYLEAQAWLTSLHGIGPKIADCVLLFGAAKYEAFPVDTWILRAMAERYGLQGWRPPQVAQFGRAHFGPLAGLAQQFLFSGERRAKKS